MSIEYCHNVNEYFDTDFTECCHSCEDYPDCPYHIK